MKIPTKSLTQLVLGTVVGIGVVSLLLPQPSWGQATEVNPLQEFESQDNTSDPFSGRNEAGSFGVFDLIHRANLGNTRSLSDYSAEQNENLDAAAAEFRARQLQRIQGQDQPSQGNPVTKTQTRN